MKNILHILCVFILLCSLTACSLAKDSNDEMFIQNTELSEQEKAILDLVDAEIKPYILNFAVDDSIKSLQITSYELQNNVWKIISNSTGAFEKNRG